MLLIDRVVITDPDVEIRYVLPITPESEHVRFCQLRKDYFGNPAPQQQKVDRNRRAFDDVDRPTAEFSEPVEQCVASIGAVDKEMARS